MWRRRERSVDRTLALRFAWAVLYVVASSFAMFGLTIQRQSLMSVEPGPGLIFFAAVVAFTMLAVELFDPWLVGFGKLARGRIERG